MSQKRFPAVLLFGAPGVGKGTQGKILSNIPGFFHLSSGEVFRSLDGGSPEGAEVAECLSHGNLVHDDLTIRIWRNALQGQIATSAFKPREDLLILDGIPRTPGQAEMLTAHVDVRVVIHLSCAEEERMIRRIRKRAIRENRIDDANEGVIRHRFDVYREQTKAVLDCYQPNTIAEVDAIGSPANVLRAVLDVVIPVQDELYKAGEGGSERG